MGKDFESEECGNCEQREECKEKGDMFDEDRANLKTTLVANRQWFGDRPELGDKILAEAKHNLCTLLTHAVGSNPLLRMSIMMSDDGNVIQAMEMAFLLGYKKGFEDKNVESILADTQQK